jgi:aryl-alcohol dehydrogenase-like predicted oxidoreductase
VVERVRNLKAIADDLGINRAQLAIAWILRHPEVASVITGATRPEQIESNAKAAEVEIPEEALARIDELFPVE